MNETTPSDTPQIDPAKIQALEQRLLSEQNMPLAIGAGAVAALIGAALWAVVTVSSNYQIGWMAVGVGILVGWMVRIAGKGVTKPFGIIGAVFALLGCLLGNLLSVYGFAANELHMSFFTAFSNLPFALVQNVFTENMSPMDFLFYGIAVFEGYKFSIRQLTAADLN